MEWLLEADVFEEGLYPLIKELTNQGISFLIHPHAPFQTDRHYLNFFPENACVLFYGSLNFAAQIKREASWVPGIYCNMPEFNCSYYYPVFGDFLLNSQYLMMPLGDLDRNKKFLYKTLGYNNCLFIRPNKGNKCFTGKVVYKEEWAKDLDLFRFCGVEDEELCVIAPAQDILQEWRLVIAEGKVISGSEYKPSLNSFIPADVMDFGNQMAILPYEPDPLWVLDVIRLRNNELKVVEVNSFSCAGFYKCDMEPIVSKASEIALKEWGLIYV